MGDIQCMKIGQVESLPGYVRYPEYEGWAGRKFTWLCEISRV